MSIFISSISITKRKKLVGFTRKKDASLSILGN